MKRVFDAVQYFRDPEETRKAFRGGYFHSGDLAVMHPDGAVAIVDRSKDIIISGGEVRRFIRLKKVVHPHHAVLVRMPPVLLSNKVSIHQVHS